MWQSTTQAKILNVSKLCVLVCILYIHTFLLLLWFPPFEFCTLKAKEKVPLCLTDPAGCLARLQATVRGYLVLYPHDFLVEEDLKPPLGSKENLISLTVFTWILDSVPGWDAGWYVCLYFDVLPAKLCLWHPHFGIEFAVLSLGRIWSACSFRKMQR